jgi:hypothetical protein
MDKLKPYMFWIICGALLLIELVLCVFISPEGTIDKKALGDATLLKLKPGTPVTSVELATEHELQYKALEGYAKRAKQPLEGKLTLAKDEINPESEKSRKDAMDLYLPNKEWANQIESKTKSYRESLRKIDETLAEASIKKDMQEFIEKMNMDKANPTTDPQKWYANYSEKTTEFLKSMAQARLIPLQDANQKDINFATDSGARRFWGFITKETDTFPVDAAQAGRLFLLKLFCEPLLSPEAVAVFSENPYSKNVEIELPQGEDLARPRIVNLSLETTPKSTGANDPISVYRVSLELEGAPAALRAALRVIDAAKKPIMVRTGETWTPSTKVSDPDLRDTTRKDWFMTVKTTVLMCDFTLRK